MKAIHPIILVAIILLASCSPAASAQPTAEGGQSLSSSLDQATPTPAGEEQNNPKPAIRWNTSPDTLIVSVTNCCGFAPELVKINYIPEAQIWGDGRILWTQFGADGQRSVLEGMLASEQLSRLLQRAVDQGFFGWQELYTSPTAPTDLPSKCLFIQLESQSRKVCEYYEGAPQAFHDLYNDLSSGLQTTGQAYIPSQGYLVAYPVGKPERPDEQRAVNNWGEEARKLPLSEAVDGVWIEGSTLEKTWSFVNASPYGGTTLDGAMLYQLSLQIPGVSMIAPPQP